MSTLGLVAGLSLIAPSSDAAQPAPRQQATAKASARKPPARKELRLSSQARQQLSRPTIKAKPRRHIPLTRKEVRNAIPANHRPPRALTKGKAKTLTNAELTRELNAIEKRLNRQGYSLRDSKTVVYHEHQPNRAKLGTQVDALRAVARTKPKRAPSTRKQLRSRVRTRARAPAHKPSRARSTTNGYWAPAPGAKSAKAHFDWSPGVGDTSIGSAFMTTKADFSGSQGGFEPGLHGRIEVRAGGYVLGERVEVARLEASVDASPGQDYTARVVAVLPGDFEYPIYEYSGAQPKVMTQTMDLFDYEQTFHTTVPIVGYPVDVDVIVSPSIAVDFELHVNESYVIGSFEPVVKVEATIEAYLDAFLAQAGAGGSSTIVSVRPRLEGAAYFGDQGGATTVNAEVSGNIRAHFLEGRLYAFLEIGWWIFKDRFEWELWNYDGWGIDYPFFEWDSSKS